MTLPYLFVFLAGCCVAVRSAFGVAAVIGRCMRAYRTLDDREPRTAADALARTVSAEPTGDMPSRSSNVSKIGVGGTASQRRTGADDLGPRPWPSHGREYERRTRGSLPDSQEGRHGSHHAGRSRMSVVPGTGPTLFDWETTS